MLIKSFPAGPWATNCYLVANEANSECIIIDPGFESLSGIKELLSNLDFIQLQHC